MRKGQKETHIDFDTHLTHVFGPACSHTEFTEISSSLVYGNGVASPSIGCNEGNKVCLSFRFAHSNAATQLIYIVLALNQLKCQICLILLLSRCNTAFFFKFVEPSDSRLLSNFLRPKRKKLSQKIEKETLYSLIRERIAKITAVAAMIQVEFDTVLLWCLSWNVIVHTRKRRYYIDYMNE